MMDWTILVRHRIAAAVHGNVIPSCDSSVEMDWQMLLKASRNRVFLVLSTLALQWFLWI